MRIFVAKDLHNEVKFWSIGSDGNIINIYWGDLEDQVKNRRSYGTRSDVNKEVSKRINEKLKNGYVEISSYNDWHKVIDLTNKTFNGNVRISKCHKFRDFSHKLNDYLFAQPKVNGLRAYLLKISVTEGVGMFSKTFDKVILLSSEGHEYVLPHITNHLPLSAFSDNVIYDGELYIPGKKLNEIKKSVPMKNEKGTISKVSGNPLEVQFWCFDLAMDNMEQDDRFRMYTTLQKEFPTLMKPYLNDDVINYKFGNNPFVVLGYTDLFKSDCIMFSEKCIKNGFEGGIFRNMYSLYAFGQRSYEVQKLKFFTDTECEILDVIPKEKEPQTGIFVLKNDINTATFKCNPVGSFEQRSEYLRNKSYYIGKKATVAFYERSGVDNVPFHANVITIRDYD